MLERSFFIINFKQEIGILKLELRVYRSDLAAIIKDFLNNCFGSKNLVRFFGMNLDFHQLILSSDVVNVKRTGGIVTFLSVDLHVSMDDGIKVVMIGSFE